MSMCLPFTSLLHGRTSPPRRLGCCRPRADQHGGHRRQGGPRPGVTWRPPCRRHGRRADTCTRIRACARSATLVWRGGGGCPAGPRRGGGQCAGVAWHATDCERATRGRGPRGSSGSGEEQPNTLSGVHVVTCMHCYQGVTDYSQASPLPWRSKRCGGGVSFRAYT